MIDQIILSCPNCNGTNIKFSNCGYSSFDCCSAKCQCGHEIKLDGSDARTAWNKYPNNKKARLLYHWLLSQDRWTSKDKIVDIAISIFNDGHLPQNYLGENI